MPHSVDTACADTGAARVPRLAKVIATTVAASTRRPRPARIRREITG